MASKYDYRDPGTDPEYCNGLAPEPETTYECWNCGAIATYGILHACDTEACDVGDVGTVGDDFPELIADEPTCYYCGVPIDARFADENDYYCSSLCAAYAERDNREDRPV
jgi:hypothetical protein